MKSASGDGEVRSTSSGGRPVQKDSEHHVQKEENNQSAPNRQFPTAETASLPHGFKVKKKKKYEMTPSSEDLAHKSP